MKKEYDVIVIGAGNAGLVSALTLQKQNKKVLLLESGRFVGGLSASFVRGEFTFDTNFDDFLLYGNGEERGIITSLFERLAIVDQLHPIKRATTFKIYTLNDKKEYEFPFGVNEFLAKMEDYVAGSQKSVKEFLQISKEVYEACLNIMEMKGKMDFTLLEEKYPKFLEMASLSLEEGLKFLKIPRKAAQLLSGCWLLLGSPVHKVSFVTYAFSFYAFLSFGGYGLEESSHDISLILSEEFLKYGGTLKCLNEVREIMVENNEVVGVVTTKNEQFYSKKIVADISPTKVYGSLIKDNVPLKAKTLTSNRLLGALPVTVFLGLDKSLNSLELHEGTSFIYYTLNSQKEYKMMHKLSHPNLHVWAKNVLEDKAIIKITGFVYKDAFKKMVTKENYFALKKQLTENLILMFEEATGKEIKKALWEIEAATPLTYERYLKHPGGTIFGYLASGLDDFLPRILNECNEEYIKGLYFTGSFGAFLASPYATYLNGEYIANKLLGGDSDAKTR